MTLTVVGSNINLEPSLCNISYELWPGSYVAAGRALLHLTLALPPSFGVKSLNRTCLNCNSLYFCTNQEYDTYIRFIK